MVTIWVWAGGRVCGAGANDGPLGACAGVEDKAGAVIGAAAATGDS